MYSQKVPKNQKINTCDYIVHKFHTIPKNKDRQLDYIQFAAYDPGTKNLGIRVEREYPDGTIIGLLHKNFSPNNEGEKHESYLHSSITDFLILHKELFDGCHYHIIERQMAINYQAIRVQQHIQTYLMTTYRNSDIRPYIIEADAKIKGRKLGCPKGLNKPAYKKWCTDKALLLLKERNDIESYNKIMASKKKDDLADTVCLIEAIRIILNISCNK